MSYELIALTMFVSMMARLLAGQRVFGTIGFVAVVSALFLWGGGGSELAFSAAMKVMKWYPPLTLPLFIFWTVILASPLANSAISLINIW